MGQRNSALIAVDGGITPQTLPQVSSADVAISGSYVLHHPSYSQAISSLKQKAKVK